MPFPSSCLSSLQALHHTPFSDPLFQVASDFKIVLSLPLSTGSIEKNFQSQMFPGLVNFYLVKSKLLTLRGFCKI